MTNTEIYNLIQPMFAAVDPDTYPETYRVLHEHSGIEDDGFYLDMPLLQFAMTVHGCDGGEPLLPEVADFLMQVYFDEYAKGSADAALNLGSMYYLGRGVEQSYRQAVEYYTFAADRGSLIAAENLGYCYYYGRDVEVDYEKAFRYFSKGAFAGQPISLYKIGDMYRNGYYVDKDEATAFRIYSHCLDLVDDIGPNTCIADVAMRVASCYHHGIGTDVDLDGAMFFAQLSEREFYKRLKDGDRLIEGSLRRVIAEEEEIREEIREALELDK